MKNENYILATIKNWNVKVYDEATPDPHPRSRGILSALAKVRGSESGFYFAESFMISKTFL